jgi:hypothetical protein
MPLKKKREKQKYLNGELDIGPLYMCCFNLVVGNNLFSISFFVTLYRLEIFLFEGFVRHMEQTLRVVKWQCP